MSTETYRNPEMQAMVDAYAKNVFGRTRSEAATQGVCVTCGKPITSFRDELSVREYAISGICQTCQDGVFDESDNDEPDPEPSKAAGTLTPLALQALP